MGQLIKVDFINGTAETVEMAVAPTRDPIGTAYARENSNGCWISTKTPDRKGYIKNYLIVNDRKIQTYTHIVSYQAVNGLPVTGRLEEGEAHHLCHCKNCIRPDHISPELNHSKLHESDRITGKKAKAKIHKAIPIAFRHLAGITDYETALVEVMAAADTTEIYGARVLKNAKKQIFALVALMLADGQEVGHI